MENITLLKPEFLAESENGNSDIQIGALSRSTGEGSGFHQGLRGEAIGGTNSAGNTGLRGAAVGTAKYQQGLL
ncbi:MAG: hypothetical protein AAFN93_18925, partial [Bacteroidota bacterium]